MISKIYLASFCIIAVAVAYRPKVTSPVSISTSLLDRNESLTPTCPTHSTVEQEIGKTKDCLNEDHTFRQCGCGDSSWTRVALFNYSIHPCPDGLSRQNRRDPDTQQVITGCISDSSSSVLLPVNGMEYSTVCGRILGYGGGGGFSDYFDFNYTIDDWYMTGVSLTHGPPGNRSHIWSFTSASCEQDNNNPRFICPCTNTDIQWPYQTPSFVGDDYFCVYELEQQNFLFYHKH